MNSFLLPEFLVLYRAVPESVRKQARQAYAIFQRDPHHPSLRGKGTSLNFVGF